MNLRPPGPQPGALPDCATPRDRSVYAVHEARDGPRTRDLELGRLALYQLSYTRKGPAILVGPFIARPVHCAYGPRGRAGEADPPARRAGQPRGRRGVGFGVAAIGIGLLLVIARAGRALELRADRAERGRRRLQRRPARQEDAAPADPAVVRADVDRLAVPGPAAVPVGGLAAALHHHERARRRRPCRRRQRARADRGRRRRRARGEDQLHHRVHRHRRRQADEGVRRALRQPHLSRPRRRTAAAPVGRRRGVRRVPRHRVPPRARQRAARDDRALPVQRAGLLVRPALQQDRRAGRRGPATRRTPTSSRSSRRSRRRSATTSPATSAATTSRTCR